MSEPIHFTPPGLEPWERECVTALAVVIEAGDWAGPEGTISRAMPDYARWQQDHIRDITAHVMYEAGWTCEAMARLLRSMVEEATP